VLNLLNCAILFPNGCFDSTFLVRVFEMIRNRYCYDISGIEQCHLSPSRKKVYPTPLPYVDCRLIRILEICFCSWMVCWHCVMSCIIVDWRFGANSGWKFLSLAGCYVSKISLAISSVFGKFLVISAAENVQRHG
jgi:hypothetical protein